MQPVPERVFISVAALLFVVSAAATIAWCGAMNSMAGMEMPGRWTMSMAWMRMPGQSWPGAAGSFLGMWILMMVAMMLPALVPMLRRYRASVAPVAGLRLGLLTLMVGVAYFSVWALSGGIAFLFGVTFATFAMQSPELARVVPVAAALIVVSGGALQFTAWKSRQLDCCNKTPASGATLAADARTAWSHGLRLGVYCCRCCAGLTAILLAVGVMDLSVMAIVTAAISLERLAPAAERVARGIGAVVVAAGMFQLMRAIGG